MGIAFDTRLLLQIDELPLLLYSIVLVVITVQHVTIRCSVNFPGARSVIMGLLLPLVLRLVAILIGQGSLVPQLHLVTVLLCIGCELHAAGGADVESSGECAVVVDRGGGTIHGLWVLVAQLRRRAPMALIHFLNLIVQHRY